MTYFLARRGRAVLRCLRLTEANTHKALPARLSENACGASISIRNISSFSRPAVSYPSLSAYLRKSYSSAAGRPKAHTGRTTASKSKGKPKSSNDKKGASKKSSSTGKKAKKAAPKRKQLTDKQKEAREKKKQREEIRQLREAALTPPKRLSSSAYQLVCKEQGGSVTKNIEVYKNLPLAERQVSTERTMTLNQFILL